VSRFVLDIACEYSMSLENHQPVAIREASNTKDPGFKAGLSGVVGGLSLRRMEGDSILAESGEEQFGYDGESKALS